ncbi:hypothetical protein CBS101457_003467 [Exobasidium rhododendri]|nr:hypothetical protein CBS101457_003467 [Exobasidium rhododendri]
MHLLTQIAAVAAAAASLARAANVTLDWNVSWVDNINPDGLMVRRGIGVNGQFPPPVINVNQSDFLTINVNNAFGDGRGTSLHSHGMFFNQTAYWDGAAMITQCPIPDGQSVAYEPLNSPNSPTDRQAQWGTFWTHGHYDGQYVDGLRTPAIIHAESEPHAYDDDYTIILADWYHREHEDLIENEFLNIKNPTGAEPVPASGLVYIAHTPANGQAAYLTGYNDNSTLPFEAGKTYRLRLINMSALSMYHFWIDGHDMSVIEADGVDTEAKPVDLVSLAVAQRYSILVTARNDTSENWLIHANLDPDMYDAVPDTLQLNITSTISYAQGNPVGSNRSTVEEYSYFDDTALTPIVALAMVEADVSHEMPFAFDTYRDGKNYAAFNDKSFVTPETPTLFTAQSMPLNETSETAVYGPNAGAAIFEHMDMIEVVFINTDTGAHPFHIHGTQFQIVHKSLDVTSSDPAINPPFQEGQLNPMRRDTVQIPAGGSATIRFRADNPGVWFVHCHIDWHLSSGLAAVFIEAPDQMNLLKTPSVLAEQCQMMGMPSTGNAGGLQSTTNFGTLSAGPMHLISGWTSTAIGTFVACIISALIGLISISWYGFASGGDPEDEDVEEEEEEVKSSPTAAGVL